MDGGETAEDVDRVRWEERRFLRKYLGMDLAAIVLRPAHYYAHLDEVVPEVSRVYERQGSTA